jgi:hypothetical protein
MAALATQNVGNGAAVTTAAAAGGGDTLAGGPADGGWDTTFLLAVVGGTATTITVDGVANGPFTSQTVIIPVRRYNGAPVNVTYSQVTAVTVGSIHLGAPMAGITFGT